MKLNLNLSASNKAVRRLCTYAALAYSTVETQAGTLLSII